MNLLELVKGLIAQNDEAIVAFAFRKLKAAIVEWRSDRAAAIKGLEEDEARLVNARALVDAHIASK